MTRFYKEYKFYRVIEECLTLIQEANKLIGDHKLWLLDKNDSEYKIITRRIYKELLEPSIWYLEPLIPFTCQIIQKNIFGKCGLTHNFPDSNYAEKNHRHLFPRKLRKDSSGVQSNAKILLW